MRGFTAWLVIACLFVCWGANLLAEEPLDFNRDVRPILSDKCFSCHGQDANQRQAELRLDVLPTSKAIVPGKPDESSVIERIDSTDVDEIMPPPKSNKVLSATERAILRRWIAEGARYDKHWALVPPRKPEVDPSMQPIDSLVSKKLDSLGWQLSPAAAPELWLRRVSMDLHGLPPTIPDVDNFLQALPIDGERAYEREVDRLLASPRFGERMAQEWLDAARYADTHGFNNDSARIMWRWRDWVIDAFNANMPYDQFITEQLAGDLLPDPALEQRIATGFCRNHVINSEGGIIDEEYRIEYVADRVRTMSTAWLGMTMECSRCHDHKFDPISQKDYYQMFAFFNNVPEHGEDGRIANAAPLIAAPTKTQQRELERQRKQLAELSQQIVAARRTVETEAGFEEAVRAFAVAFKGKKPDEVVDKLGGPHEGKTDAVSGNKSAPAAKGTGGDTATDVKATEAKKPAESAAAGQSKIKVPLASFSLNCNSTEPGESKWKLLAEPPAVVDGVVESGWKNKDSRPIAEIAAGQLNFAKRLTVAMWVQPSADNPRDVALLSGVNYDGNPNSSGYGKGHEIRLIDGEIEVRGNEFFPAYSMRVRSQGAGIAVDTWHHIVVVTGGSRYAKDVHIFVDGQELSTVALYDGATSDAIAASSIYIVGAERSKESAVYRGALDELAGYASELKPAEVKLLFRSQALPYASARLDAADAAPHVRNWVVNAWIASADQPSHSKLAALMAEHEKLWQDHLTLQRVCPSAMVMQELPTPRTTYLLKRGAYDAHGDQVTAQAPEWIAAWPDGAPRNRLGLAKWLTSRSHPLCSRVVVNRLWAQLFGSGIVRTLEDFGFQGDYPSHPELLDWLACEFMESGWNVKSLIRTIVLSKTYRQASRVTSEHLARDPENRWLARAPRVRLSAETLRDQALSLSGLLRERVGGPSVYPYQPDGLYNGLVVGATYPGTQWELSKGDDLFRRSLYTFIKRTVPHPLMQTFDAPDREFCTVRRSRTNTPLQALLLMNEPGFYESAQRLGQRLETEGGSSEDSKLRWAFRHVTARQPTPEEFEQLRTTLQTAQQSDPKTAYTILASVLLNLDETVTRE